MFSERATELKVRFTGHVFHHGSRNFQTWGLRVVLGYVLAFSLQMGSLGVWLATAVSNVVGVIAALWIKYGSWARAIIKNK